LIGLATAALDVSDGLIADLGHICEVSNLTAILAAPRVPLSPAARAAIAAAPERLANAVTGGDDYEIVFTAPEAAATELVGLSRALGIGITAIGHMVAPAAGAEKCVIVVDADGKTLEFASEGWQHF
jgi:thiamine-monophosphate kinase